jgi:hypothetical protein
MPVPPLAPSLKFAAHHLPTAATHIVISNDNVGRENGEYVVHLLEDGGDSG